MDTNKITLHKLHCPLCVRSEGKFDGALYFGAPEFFICIRAQAENINVTLAQVVEHKMMLEHLYSKKALEEMAVSYNAVLDEPDEGSANFIMEKRLAKMYREATQLKCGISKMIWEQALPSVVDQLISQMSEEKIKAVDLANILQLLLKCGLAINENTFEDTYWKREVNKVAGEEIKKVESPEKNMMSDLSRDGMKQTIDALRRANKMLEKKHGSTDTKA
jgi:hypothetical protein